MKYHALTYLLYVGLIPTFEWSQWIRFTFETVRTGLVIIATKMLVITAAFLVVPPVLWVAYKYIGVKILEAAGTVTANSGILQAVTIELTGLGAWMASCLNLPQCVSVVVTGCAVAFAFRLVKF